MSEFLGTKGKWYLDEEIKGAEMIVTDLYIQGNVVCIKPETSYKESGKNWKANAQLIAHAPEMLEMLEYFVQNNMLSIAGEEMAEKLIQKSTKI